MSQPDSATAIGQNTDKGSSATGLSHQVVLQKLIPGETQLFPVSDVLLMLPNSSQIDLTTRMADHPTYIRTPGVAELDKKGRLHVFNVGELADQLRFIPLNINDHIELFLPSDPKDRHILRFALEHYYRAIQGRGKFDAAPFIRLCFVCKASQDPKGLDEALSFRLWIKTNPKPFTKEEFLKRFPFPSSRWSYIRSLKTELQLTVPNKPVDQHSNNTQLVSEDGTSAPKIEKAPEQVVNEPLPTQIAEHLPEDAEPTSEGEASESVSQPSANSDIDNAVIVDDRATDNVNNVNNEPATEKHSIEVENSVHNLFCSLLADELYAKAKALWQQGLISRDTGTPPENLPPESWDWLCAFIAIAATHDESLREEITTLTSRFIARENNYPPQKLVIKFADFISKRSPRRFDEADIPKAVNSVLKHHCGGTRHG